MLGFRKTTFTIYRLAVVAVFVFGNFLAFAAEDLNTFYDRNRGVEISKPSSWYFLNPRQVMEGRDNVELADDEIAAIFKSGSTVPVLTITKYHDFEERSGPIPTVNLQYIKIDQIDNKHPDMLIDFSLKILRNAVSGFEYVSKPRIAQLAGFRSARATISFMLYGKQGNGYIVSSEIWVVPRGSYAIYIAMSAPFTEADNSKEEFIGILKSLKISD